MNLERSVWSSYYVDLSPEEMVDQFAEAGWTATEFSDEHGAVLLQRAAQRGISPAEVGAELKAYADARGVSFPQGHLFLKVDLCADDAEEILIPWLDLFVSLGIKSGVLHAVSRRKDFTPEMRFARWVEVLKALTAHLEGTQMSIALENVATSSDYLFDLLDAVGSDHLGICLDTGHMNLARAGGFADYTQGDFIRRAGKRLIALHIADNDTSRDQHLMPFGGGNVDFDDVVQGLADVGYTGLFNLEIPGERHAPLNVRRAKLDYLRVVGDTLLRGESLNFARSLLD